MKSRSSTALLHLAGSAAALSFLLAVTPPPIERITSDQCMNCHDGSTARQIRPETSHHVGVDYALAAAGRKKFLKPAEAASGFGSSIRNDMLVNGRVECASCHVSHDVETGQRFRLRTTEVFSSLCRACHAPL